MIELRGVRKSFDDGASWAVDGVDLAVGEGELVVLIGESGCGKTTTLKTINRLVEPTEGRIEVEGTDNREPQAHELRRRIGYVFQGIGLFPHRTVGGNVAVVPRLLGWSDDETARRVDELLALVQLDPETYRDRGTRALSGGQAQRVGLARALAARPSIMLMDEPFGALDPLTRDELQGEYRRLHDELGLTTLMVTHDMTEALLLADRIAVMEAGRTRRVGTPRELLADPREETVRRLLEMPRKQVRRVEELLEAAGGGGPRPGERP